MRRGWRQLRDPGVWLWLHLGMEHFPRQREMWVCFCFYFKFGEIMRWSFAVNMQDKDRKRNLNILSVFSDRKILKTSKPMWIMYWSNLFLFFFFNLNLGYFLIQFEFFFWQSGFSFHLGLSKSVNFSVWSLPKSPASPPAESFILAGETIGKIISVLFL